MIIVSIDTLRYDHLGCYGYPWPTSPTIDRLAARGVRFENAVSTTSWTLPAHAAMFTGLYDSTHGAFDNDRRLGDENVTLAETLVSMLIVSGLLVSALNTLGAVKWGHANISNRAKGELLAQELVGEILEMEYVEPVDTPVFGRESGETNSIRTWYDDVDDYHNWTASPPQDKSGADLTGWNGWSRSVNVKLVQKNNMMLQAMTDQGVKRITVTVTYQDKAQASLIAVRSGAATSTRKIAAGVTE